MPSPYVDLTPDDDDPKKKVEVEEVKDENYLPPDEEAKLKE
jgi:hypothetical protein